MGASTIRFALSRHTGMLAYCSQTLIFTKAGLAVYHPMAEPCGHCAE